MCRRSRASRLALSLHQSRPRQMLRRTSPRPATAALCTIWAPLGAVGNASRRLPLLPQTLLVRSPALMLSPCACSRGSVEPSTARLGRIVIPVHLAVIPCPVAARDVSAVLATCFVRRAAHRHRRRTGQARQAGERRLQASRGERAEHGAARRPTADCDRGPGKRGGCVEHSVRGASVGNARA